MEQKLLTHHYDKPHYHTLRGYQQYGGYQTLPLALKKTPEQIVEAVKDSGLRGRGGAGFPTGVKWGFLPNNNEPRYLLCNADEGEPGTFKDRMMMEKAPHQLIEGMLISAWAIRSHKSYIYIRGEYIDSIRMMEAALAEARKAGLIGKNILQSSFHHEIDVYVGAGAYICGEETGMISSLEGKKGQPKLKPPFPAVKGYLEKPTIVNNVETLASVIPIVRDGAKKYRSIGTKRSSGTKLFSVSGNVLKPGNYEVPLGYPLMDLINHLCKGLPKGRKLKAVIPGGSSASVLTAKECEKALLDYESLSDLGSMLGSGAIIVIDDSNCMVSILSTIMNFYHHESCGQCTPCREGTGWLSDLVKNILNGKGRIKDLSLIENISKNMMGKTICALSDAAALPAISFVTKFQDEFIRYIQSHSLLTHHKKGSL